MKPLYWIIGAVVLFAFFAVGGVNSIATQDEKVNASWAQVENQYQRRMDLIPNLVETVKGYADFEQQTLTDVINARAKATSVTITADSLSDPEAVRRFEQAQGEVSSALSRLMAVSERYPDLKANQNFLALQSQLEGTENRIAIARKDFIDTVRQYNTTIRTFPGLIWAKIVGAKPKQSFTADEGARKPPEVKFRSGAEGLPRPEMRFGNGQKAPASSGFNVEGKGSEKPVFRRTASGTARAVSSFNNEGSLGGGKPKFLSSKGGANNAKASSSFNREGFGGFEKPVNIGN